MGSWKTLVVPDAKPKVGASLAALGTGQYDGHLGILKIGAGVDAFIETFVWDSFARAGAGGWVGKDEHTVVSCDDAWALDWTRQPLANIRNAWCRPNGGVGWARSGGAAILRGNFVVPASGVFDIPVEDDGVNDLPNQGQVIVRGTTFTYAGKDLTPGAKKLTGCTHVFGPSGVTLPGGRFTPIIPYAPVLGGGGDPGGWGTTVQALDHVGEVWAAGFRLEERIHAWMNGSQDNKALQLAPFYINYNIGDDFLYPALDSPPPSGFIGPGLTLVGVTEHMAGITSPGSGSVIDERRFKWAEANWTSWTPVAPPNKRLLVPVIYGKMPADAADTGQAYGVTLSLRWVQP